MSHYLIMDLEQLPEKIDKPWHKNSWKFYDVFLNKYGSHVVTSVNRGASIRQTTFAESSKSYSQRDFQVKSCVSFAGPTVAPVKVGVEACANVSKEEIAATSHMNTADKLVIRGGKMETRSALRTKRTEELIEKFLREANETDAGVEHTFRSLWNILQSRFLFKPGSQSNYIKAVNLQYYYLGFLNYGCSFVEEEDFTCKNLTTREAPPTDLQNLNALWLQRAATPMTTAITSQYGVHVMGDRAFVTKRWIKKQVSLSSLHMQTTIKTGDGMGATGKSLDLGANATTTEEELGEWCGLC